MAADQQLFPVVKVCPHGRPWTYADCPVREAVDVRDHAVYLTRQTGMQTVQEANKLGEPAEEDLWP